MKVTENNIEKLPEQEQSLVKALLLDLEEINNHLPQSKNLYLDWIDQHTEYSCEWTDPCPDFYGLYRVMRNGETIGVEMNLNELDSTLCLLYELIVEDEKELES